METKNLCKYLIPTVHQAHYTMFGEVVETNFVGSALSGGKISRYSVKTSTLDTVKTQCAIVTVLFPSEEHAIAKTQTVSQIAEERIEELIEEDIRRNYGVHCKIDVIEKYSSNDK